MKNIILIVFSVLFVGVVNAQTNKDINQNPNAQAAYEKYAKVADTYITKQGTTSQETYVAIDPMEEKRIRKNIRKDYRAMRPLWRHQERMERAKNTQYVLSRPYRGYSYGGRAFINPFYGGVGLGYTLGRIRF